MGRYEGYLSFEISFNLPKSWCARVILKRDEISKIIRVKLL